MDLAESRRPLRRAGLGAAVVLVSLAALPASSVAQGAGKLVCATPVTFGTAGNDVLIGNVANNSLSAGAGNDIINALPGNDCLDGGAGDDDMNGGTGNDFASGRGAWIRSTAPRETTRSRVTSVTTS